jgi:hypothetical protein
VPLESGQEWTRWKASVLAASVSWLILSSGLGKENSTVSLRYSCEAGVDGVEGRKEGVSESEVV